MIIKQSKYGPCGLYCGACGATDCDGCQSENVDDWVNNCKFRQCSKEKSVDFCCFCDDFSCKELKEFMNDKWPHHWTMERNLEFLKKNSTDEWLRSQKEEWLCKSCGSEIKWYQKMCKCGQKLDAWEVPD